MRAHSRHSQPIGPGMPIRGTFYPSGAGRESSIGSVLPRLLTIVLAMAVVRAVIGGVKRHAGPGGMSHRRQALERLHRELHAEDAGSAPSA